MPLCQHCFHSYKGEPSVCDSCAEFKKQVHEEENLIVCNHCGKNFMPAGFDQHRWRVYYRIHEFPSGKRVRQ